MPARFLTAFFTWKFPQTGVFYTYGVGTSAAVMLLGIAVLAVVQLALSRERALSRRLWTGMLAGALLYWAFVALSYLFIFTPTEAEMLAEFYRYVSLPLLWAALTACALLLRRAGEESPKRRGAVAAALLACLAPLSHPQVLADTLINRSAVQETIWAQARTDAIVRFLRDQIDLSARPRIHWRGELDHMALRFRLIGEAEVLGGAAMAPGDYVFVGDVDQSEPLQAFSLYRVAAAGEETLAYMATAAVHEEE